MLVALLFAAFVPIHGIVLAVQPDGTAIVRNDTAPEMLPSQTRRYRISPRIPLVPGTGIDGFADLDTTPWTLRYAVVAGPFVPGLPNPGSVLSVDVGSPLPEAQLVDQRGQFVSLKRAFNGKTLLLTFVFTRCPDRTLCPAISGKYAYVQSQLDPAHFALAEITLDPPYDSPRILSDYGRSYGANLATWKLLTGEGSTIQRLLDEFGIDSMRVSASNFIHNDKLFIVRPDGKVAYIVQSAAWDPDGVIAEARSVAGLGSNPFERLKLSLVADAVAFCGGSQWAGIVLLELSLFVVIAAFVTGGLWIVARLLWDKA